MYKRKKITRGLAPNATLGGFPAWADAAETRVSSLGGANRPFQVCAERAGRTRSGSRARALRWQRPRPARGQSRWKGRSPEFAPPTLGGSQSAAAPGPT